MALINCPDCGKEVSSKSEHCIHCGRKFTKKKSSGCFKYVLIGIGILTLLIIFSNRSAKKDENKRKEVAEKIKEKHCKVVWDSISSSERREVLKEFVENQSELEKALEPHKSLSYSLKNLLDASVKYPSTFKTSSGKGTLVYLPERFAEMKDVDKGIIEYQRSFTSENKIGMEVKGTFFLDIKYNAGCKNFEIVDFKIQ